MKHKSKLSTTWSIRYRGNRRRCSAKYLFRSGNSAGRQVINFHRRLLGNFYQFWYFDPSCLDEEKLRETGQETFHKTIYYWFKISHMQKNKQLKAV